MRTKRVVLLAISAAVALAIAGCSRLADDWRSAQAADTTEAYQQFLQQHANSEYDSQAHSRIKQLAEDRDWQQASTLDTRDAYEQFVAQHADGKWAQEARVRIENFQLTAGAGAGADATTASAPAGVGPAATPETPKTATSKPVAIGPASPPASAPVKAAQSKASSDSYAQLGAFSTSKRAESEWQRVRAKWPQQLGTLKPRYVAGKADGKTVYRLQVALSSPKKATELCAALKKQSQGCVAISD